MRSGVLDRVRASLAAAGIESIELGGIEPNPLDGPVREGIELCRSNNIDGILAVGGGSVIDTAKAIALGVPYSGDFWDFYQARASLPRRCLSGLCSQFPPPAARAAAIR